MIRASAVAPFACESALRARPHRSADGPPYLPIRKDDGEAPNLRRKRRARLLASLMPHAAAISSHGMVQKGAFLLLAFQLRVASPHQPLVRFLLVVRHVHGPTIFGNANCGAT